MDGVDACAGCLGGLGGADDGEDAGAFWIVRSWGFVCMAEDSRNAEEGCGVERPFCVAFTGDVADD